ncbi:MAG TPA: DUF2490 domain-containing protein [Flavobacteriaceae bacterium]|nr:DUF2490 domain-containing protein [Flavobacteriaceae bacterium]
MKCSQLFILIGFVLLSIPLAAQETFYTEIDAKWKFNPNPENRWSYSFGSKYRSHFYDSGDFGHDTDFLQLNAAPSFEINSNHSVSLEFRYRIKKLFDNQKTDEKRIIQQYNHSHKSNRLNFKGRLRVEQRFRESFTLRNRYRFGVSFPLNRNPNKLKRWKFTADTEFLWSIGPEKNPRFDQRVSVALAKPLSDTFTFKLKPQYRYLDYTQNKRSVWQIYATLSISI